MTDRNTAQHSADHTDKHVLIVRKGEGILSAMARHWKEIGEEVWPREVRIA